MTASHHDLPCRYEVGNRPPAAKRTFKGYWDLRCEDSWRRALYLFSAGAPESLCTAAAQSVSWLLVAHQWIAGHWACQGPYVRHQAAFQT